MTDATPKPQAIAAAAAAILPEFRSTPLIRHDALDDDTGARVWAKVETLTPIRSFKGRGADWFLRQASAEGDDRPLVAASAGNFGQGLAYAATRRGRRLTVFAAETANALKVAAMRRLGAEIRQQGRDFDAAKDAARTHAAATGGRFVEDGAEAAIAEGAGTIAWEIDQAGLRPDVMLIPLGNGALATGMGAWIKSTAAATRVIAVAAAGAPAMAQSFAAGRCIETAEVATIADGIAVRVPVPEAVAAMAATIDEVMTVDEDTIRAAMRLAHRRLGLVVEPAGVAGLAALLARPDRFAGRTVATPLCGGNLTDEQIAAWLR